MNRRYTTPEDVLHVFRCFVWVTQKDDGWLEIEHIEATYPHGSCRLDRIRCR